MTGKRLSRPRLRVPDQIGVLFTRALPGLIAAGIPRPIPAPPEIRSDAPAGSAFPDGAGTYRFEINEVELLQIELGSVKGPVSPAAAGSRPASYRGFEVEVLAAERKRVNRVRFRRAAVPSPA